MYGKAIKVIGAGPGTPGSNAPTTMDNTDVGFRADATANGSTFANFGYFGNYTSRIDGPARCSTSPTSRTCHRQHLDRAHGLHVLGANTDYMTITTPGSGTTFADGINMTNGARTTWSATSRPGRPG